MLAAFELVLAASFLRPGIALSATAPGRILPDRDAGSTGNEERVIGQRSNALRSMSMAGNARCNRVCSFVAALMSRYQWHGSTDSIEDPCLTAMTAYSARSMIYQDRRDTLISDSMRIGRTNNIRHLWFAS
jgi:hypothetical protein